MVDAGFDMTSTYINIHQQFQVYGSQNWFIHKQFQGYGSPILWGPHDINSLWTNIFAILWVPKVTPILIPQPRHCYGPECRGRRATFVAAGSTPVGERLHPKRKDGSWEEATAGHSHRSFFFRNETCWNMGVSENVVYYPKPNGFHDHYPVFKWLAITGNINPTFSDKATCWNMLKMG